MSLPSSQRRDQRRRLIVSWRRSAGTAEAPTVESPRSMAAYDSAALPEKQTGPAVLLPTTLGGFSLATLAIMLPLGAAVAAAVSGPLLGRDLFVGGGRFARTVAATGAIFDAQGLASLPGWLAQAYLLVAAGIAMIVRLMRRHRRDDFKGRFRAWGWMAVVLVAVACAGAVPLGPLVSAAISDATGVAVGPAGIGWWILLSSVAVAVVSLWAVLPLHERLATGVWLALAVAGWGCSAAATWLAEGRDRIAVAGGAAWTLAAGFAVVAMLAAARSVIREVRGQCGAVAPKASKPAKAELAKSVSRPADEDEVDSSEFEAADGAAESSETVYVDGSEQEHEHRHLSKAERKRLRKLARMNGAAA
jgi:hypothetical protein